MLLECVGEPFVDQAVDELEPEADRALIGHEHRVAGSGPPVLEAELAGESCSAEQRVRAAMCLARSMERVSIRAPRAELDHRLAHLPMSGPQYSKPSSSG